MNPAMRLLAECEACGVRLTPVDGGGLEIDAPREAMTQEFLDGLVSHKAELLDLLHRRGIINILDDWGRAEAAKAVLAMCDGGRGTGRYRIHLMAASGYADLIAMLRTPEFVKPLAWR
jgi:hypothetical protein